MARIFIVIMVFLLCSLPLSQLSAQKYKRGHPYEFNMERLTKTNTIVWYGWDFSYARYTDYLPEYNVEMILKKHIPSMVQYFNREFPEKRLKRMLNKDTLDVNLEEIQARNYSIDRSTFMSNVDYVLTMENIKQIISGYTISRSNGVGFVVLIENFNKPHRFVSSYPIFFDLGTREILFTARMIGKPGSMFGFEEWWEAGIEETLVYFFRRYY